jgi:hypothetical protein
LWRCKNTLRAILRIECCATLANTAFLSSLKPAAPARAMPSERHVMTLCTRLIPIWQKQCVLHCKKFN